MTEETLAQRTSKRMQQELDDFHNDPQRVGQQKLDVWWQGQLDLRAEARRRIEGPGVVNASCGVYDPMRRFQDETD